MYNNKNYGNKERRNGKTNNTDRINKKNYGRNQSNTDGGYKKPYNKKYGNNQKFKKNSTYGEMKKPNNNNRTNESSNDTSMYTMNKSMHTKDNITLGNITIPILIICGPSGQGKNTFEKMLNEFTDRNKIGGTSIEFRKIPQCTTRARRENESTNPNESYKFVSKEEYDNLNKNGHLFGRTHIDYEDGHTDYYGSFLSAREIARATFKALYLNTKVVFTVILNAGGIEDAMNNSFTNKIGLNPVIGKQTNIKIDDNTVISPVISFIYVDGNNTLKRDGRDESFVENERKSLEPYKDYFISEVFNDFQNGKLANKETINGIIPSVESILDSIEKGNLNPA